MQLFIFLCYTEWKQEIDKNDYNCIFFIAIIIHQNIVTAKEFRERNFYKMDKSKEKCFVNMNKEYFDL